jgi:hypothetical protein
MKLSIATQLGSWSSPAASHMERLFCYEDHSQTLLFLKQNITTNLSDSPPKKCFRGMILPLCHCCPLSNRWLFLPSFARRHDLITTLYKAGARVLTPSFMLPHKSHAPKGILAGVQG